MPLIRPSTICAISLTLTFTLTLFQLMIMVQHEIFRHTHLRLMYGICGLTWTEILRICTLRCGHFAQWQLIGNSAWSRDVTQGAPLINPRSVMWRHAWRVTSLDIRSLLDSLIKWTAFNKRCVSGGDFISQHVSDCATCIVLSCYASLSCLWDRIPHCSLSAGRMSLSPQRKDRKVQNSWNLFHAMRSKGEH